MFVARGLCLAGTVGMVLALAAPAGCQQNRRVGGCTTTERPYGPPALDDSLAQAALAELLAPGRGPRTGPAAQALGVAAPLFVQIGAVDSLADSTWRSLALQVSDWITARDAKIAERSLLRHTVGPCFPPYHVDFRACGADSQVTALLEDLPQHDWQGFTRVSERTDRRLFIAAGRSLQLMDHSVDLR